MAKRTPIDKLSSSIDKILDEYGDAVSENVSEVIQGAAKAGVKALKEQSRSTFGGSGAYAKGWKSKYEESRNTSGAILYNAKPGLPHLLEKGHAKRGGGRVEGKAHIAPVEEQIVNTVQKELEAKL